MGQLRASLKKYIERYVKEKHTLDKLQLFEGFISEVKVLYPEFEKYKFEYNKLEETDNVFEDRSDEILEHSVTARLLSFPNVIITSHQGFFTKEALSAIAQTTLENAMSYLHGNESVNDVVNL